MKYKILSSTISERLYVSVNDYLKKGWELYGYPFCGAISDRGSCICQAIIKKEIENATNI